MENFNTTTISFDTKYENLYVKIQLLIDTLNNDTEYDTLKSICNEIIEIKKLMKCKYTIKLNDMRSIKDTFNRMLEKLVLYINTKDKPIKILSELVREVKAREKIENDNQLNNLRKLNTMLIKENALLKRDKLFNKVNI